MKKCKRKKKRNLFSRVFSRSFWTEETKKVAGRRNLGEEYPSRWWLTGRVLSRTFFFIVARGFKGPRWVGVRSERRQLHPWRILRGCTSCRARATFMKRLELCRIYRLQLLSGCCSRVYPGIMRKKGARWQRDTYVTDASPRRKTAVPKHLPRWCLLSRHDDLPSFPSRR